MAPSKTFNLAGLVASFAIIPNPGLQERFERARIGQGSVNLLGLVAMEAALRHGDDYMAQLNDYIPGNMDYFAGTVARIPGMRLAPPEGPEGTYLAWVDMRELARRLGPVPATGAEAYGDPTAETSCSTRHASPPTPVTSSAPVERASALQPGLSPERGGRGRCATGDGRSGATGLIAQ